jgi:hypothetical protein
VFWLGVPGGGEQAERPAARHRVALPHQEVAGGIEVLAENALGLIAGNAPVEPRLATRHIAGRARMLDASGGGCHASRGGLGVYGGLRLLLCL